MASINNRDRIRATTSDDVTISNNVKLLHKNPLILTIDNILSPTKVTEIRNFIQSSKSNLSPTHDYQEDVFSASATQKEDIHFTQVINQLEKSIPGEFATDPLSSFVWIVTNHPNLVDEDDIIKLANAIQRREALKKWKTEVGEALLGLSSDEMKFEKAGQRFIMPSELRSEFEALIPLFLQGSSNSVKKAQKDTAGLSWKVKDATLVVYGEEESQVPHVDPCDATLLLYLSDAESDDCVGGDTCFPLSDMRVPPKRGRGLLFFSSLLNCDEASTTLDEDSPTGDSGEEKQQTQRERDILSIHHGGRVEKGEKIVAQIMLDACFEGETRDSWLDTLLCLQE
eukprot:CAMPEP_0185736424 /NCGR_PEP_ID=MMETSP1171-20130828/27851_1 /TAXON_ID=374046 /ORGANISM="Helicotheca tamensis, Strain CCMP826" /LENGTH=340 /DNA_ID=CAMNT_0028407045 /DNA_START=190 /DNA_END=1213 /DNA_ORIENTATION=-